MKYIITIVILLFVAFTATSQPQPPSHAKNNTVGESSSGSAPLTEATFLLLGMGAAYTGYKLRKSATKNKE